MTTSFSAIDWIQKNFNSLVIGLIITLALININGKLWIILPNEELIVVFCFFSFIYYCSHGLAPSIEESLEERSSNIAKELQHSVALNKKIHDQSLISYSSQFQLAQTISQITSYSLNFLKDLKKKSKLSLHQILSNQIKSKIYGLLGLTSGFKSSLQSKILHSIRSGVALRLIRLRIKKDSSLQFALTEMNKVFGLTSAKKIKK